MLFRVLFIFEVQHVRQIHTRSKFDPLIVTLKFILSQISYDYKNTR